MVQDSCVRNPSDAKDLWLHVAVAATVWGCHSDAVDSETEGPADAGIHQESSVADGSMTDAPAIDAPGEAQQDGTVPSDGGNEDGDVGDATVDGVVPEPTPAPVLWLDWEGWQADGGAVVDVSLDDGRGLVFDGNGDVALSDAAVSEPTFSGPFTLMAEVQVQGRPYLRDAVVSKWEMTGDRRSYELGIERTQFPYVMLSGDGAWGEDSLELVGTRQVKLGRTCMVAAVFEPGVRVALYVNGQLTGETTDGVPLAVHAGEAEVTIGNRTGGGAGVEGIVGDVLWFDQALSTTQVSAWASYLGRGDSLDALPPVRAITRPPGFHWFGYYDKLQFDPTGRYVLGMKVDFEGRSPEPEDVIQIGMVDLHNGDAWVPLGNSNAWSWQQGCMLQWRPGSSTEVMWNDREGDGDAAHFVTRIMNVQTGIMRTLPRAVHHVSPDGSFAIGSDFARWGHMRVGYGYVGVKDPYEDELAPAGSTIYRMDLDTGEVKDLFDLATIAAFPHPTLDLSSAKHFFSVIQVSDSAQRFLFFHRWMDGGMGTRVFTSSVDGAELRVLTHDGGLSHMDWNGDDDVLIYGIGRGSYDLYTDEPGGGYAGTLLSQRNGHQSYLPGYDWLLTDTYTDARRDQHVYLYDILGDEIFVLGSFFSPAGYVGEHRCDPHARLSPDATKAVIDSAHGGGRQMYLIDFEGFAGPGSVTFPRGVEKER